MYIFCPGHSTSKMMFTYSHFSASMCVFDFVLRLGIPNKGLVSQLNLKKYPSFILLKIKLLI